MNTLKRNFIDTAKIVILALVLGVGANYLFADWSAPTSAPTGGNVAAPVNVGTLSQYKAGNLYVGYSSVPTSDVPQAGLVVAYGGLFGSQGLTVTGPVQITSGNPGIGKVLTSDASGNVSWQPVTASGVCSDSPITLPSTPLQYGNDTGYSEEFQNTTGHKVMVTASTQVSTQLGSQNNLVGIGVIVYSAISGYSPISFGSSSWEQPNFVNPIAYSSAGGQVYPDTSNENNSLGGDLVFIVPPGYYYSFYNNISTPNNVQIWDMCQ